MKQELKVALFSGGRGTESIAQALLKHPQVALTVIINAYDDGLSTGAMRRFIPGMLGPSDVRKNISRMMRLTDDCDRSLRAISDYRLPLDTSFEAGLQLLDDIRRYKCPGDGFVAQQYPNLSIDQAQTLARYCGAFYAYSNGEAGRGNVFSFSDCALGNIIFAGSFLCCCRDFNRTIEELSALYKLRGRLINVTRGENYFLVARKQDGSFLLSEAAIVSDNEGASIDRLYLLDQGFYNDLVGSACADGSEQMTRAIDQAARQPDINPEADRILREADIVVYGPGTQHSSLFPSYLTLGVAEAIADNRDGDKLFLANIWRDLDIQKDDASSLVKKFLQAMARYGEVTCHWQDFVTHFFFQKPATGESTNGNRYVAFNPASFEFPPERVKLVNWEVEGGKHSGGRVFEELHAIVQSRISIARLHYAVSIIVPVLNEAETVADVLTSVQALDFGRLDLGKEIIVVDGGSFDGTADIARRFRSVKVIQLPKKSGKGEAVRAGIEAAVGNVVVTFPGDGEYSANDIYPIVEAIVKNRYPVVFGSRATKCVNLDQRIHQIYGQSPLSFMVSKYGGMVLSILTLLLYNKYVSDLLTSIKGFDVAALRGLKLRAKSFDLEAELTAKLALRQYYLLELPVEYSPRTRSQGKKIRLADGLRCIKELLRHKFNTRGSA
jgi:2-phospho-L-lactate transferase/gluconeogenesis factor (CofD/UPF0052 family)